MKVIFLDIDGVLCTYRSHLVYGKEGGKYRDWDPLGCCAVAKACHQTGVKIVISSSWRYSRNVHELLLHLDFHGLSHYLCEPNWKTPDHSLEDRRGNIVRGEEIKEFLDKNPEVKSYRILDDHDNFLPAQMPFLIQTVEEEGLSAMNIKKLLNWAGALKS